MGHSLVSGEERWNATHPMLKLRESGSWLLTTNLTLSSAKRRRLPARAGATISVAREQDLTRGSMTNKRR